jgi:hypothetical protein
LPEHAVAEYHPPSSPVAEEIAGLVGELARWWLSAAPARIPQVREQTTG